MSRSQPFDELGDRKPAPNPNSPQAEMPLSRKPINQLEWKKRQRERLAKMRAELGI
jgi:hypothetical protein